MDRPGTVWFSVVSLFPPTFKDQPNGFRPDIMQMMVDMKPKFLRFPGGNYLEGDQIADRFEWKKTIGPLSDRPGTWRRGVIALPTAWAFTNSSSGATT